jgi:hypothetical protein
MQGAGGKERLRRLNFEECWAPGELQRQCKNGGAERVTRRQRRGNWRSQRSDTGGGEGEYELPVQSLAQVLDRLCELLSSRLAQCALAALGLSGGRATALI